MDRNRLMMIAAVVAAIVVVAGGFLLGVKPQLDAASTARATEDSVTAQNAQLQTSLTSLKKQYDSLDDLKSELADLKQSVPADVETGSLITELNGVAKSSQATLSNIQFGSASAYVAPVAAAAPAAAASTGTSEATATPSPSASATPSAPIATTDSLITASNFTTIPLTVSVQGTYAQALAFLQGMRDGDRLFLVTNITSAAGSSDTGGESTTDSVNATDTINWTFGGLVYALADADSVQETQQSTTSTAADAASASSSTDTAAGK
jgi:hypothetical protein